MLGSQWDGIIIPNIITHNNLSLTLTENDQIRKGLGTNNYP
jgi:hypothetical protein